LLAAAALDHIKTQLVIMVMDQHLKLVVDRRVGRELIQGTELVIDIVTLELSMLVSRALVVEEVELEPLIQVVLEMDLLDNLVL
tara:strand:- start:1243 stop:1494 length:252 start_codon:yes stop_codon:yes gene_type:complete